jgi:hypothetical protein
MGSIRKSVSWHTKISDPAGSLTEVPGLGTSGDKRGIIQLVSIFLVPAVVVGVAHDVLGVSLPAAFGLSILPILVWMLCDFLQSQHLDYLSIPVALSQLFGVIYAAAAPFDQRTEFFQAAVMQFLIAIMILCFLLPLKLLNKE